MAHDLQLNLDVLLPDAHGHLDRCVDELLAAMEATDGVTAAHIVPPDDGSPARLCLSVEPGLVSLRRITDKANSAGVEISQRYGHDVWALAGISHVSRARNATATLKRLPGVIDAVVAIGGRTRIEFDRQATSSNQLRSEAVAAGLRLSPLPHGRLITSSGQLPRYTAGRVDQSHPIDDVSTDDGPRDVGPTDDRPRDDSPWHSPDRAHDPAQMHANDPGHSHGSGHGHDHTHGHGHGGPSELVVAAIAFTVFLAARIADWVTDWESGPTIAYVLVVCVAGFMVARDVLGTLRARRFDIEMLMLAAAGGAAALGDWSDAALLLALFSLGHGLEGFAMDRARDEIERLSELAPPNAHRAEPDGSVTEVSVDELRVGDEVLVKPNERLPVDGVVIDGHSAVDEAPVTGESIPVDKSPADERQQQLTFDEVDRAHRVFSGTLNGTQALRVRVSRVAGDSTLAKVVQLVAEAETQVSPTQLLTQRIVRVFVPSVLGLVALLLVLPPLFGAAFRPTFMRAMAVLVASSPCALAIATPSAVLSGIARAARDGVLIKGGGPLETLGRVCAIAFDKTGTLTVGKPRLVAVEPVNGVSRTKLLGIAVAVEAQSDHPLARAIVADANRFIDKPLQIEATAVESEVGRGVTAIIDGTRIAIGNASLFDGVDLGPELTSRLKESEKAGHTTMVICANNEALGLLAVTDVARSEGPETLNQLRDLGIHRTIMISGDHQGVAEAIAQQVGIDEARGGLLPQDKVMAIRELAAVHPGGIAMVGDGVNDAPALAAANVGIAMGAAGSAVALETADIALMADRLDRLPFAVRLARRASRIITQNLVISMGMVVILVPLTIAGVGIGPAVIAHEGSTLVVVANALRLLAHRDDHATTYRIPSH